MIYIAKCRDMGNIYKIGFSNDPLRRMRTYSTVCKHRFDVLDMFDLPNASGYGPEMQIHYALFKYRENNIPLPFGTEVYRGEYEEIKTILYAEIQRYIRQREAEKKNKSEKTIIKQLRQLLDSHNIDHSCI